VLLFSWLIHFYKDEIILTKDIKSVPKPDRFLKSIRFYAMFFQRKILLRQNFLSIIFSSKKSTKIAQFKAIQIQFFRLFFVLLQVKNFKGIE